MDIPKSTSIYSFYILLYYSSILIVVSYSAALISFLTYFTFRLPFNSLEQFHQLNTHKLIVVQKSAKLSYFLDSQDPFIRSIQDQQLDKQNLPSSYIDAIYMICDNPKYTLFALQYPIDFLVIQSGRCSIESIYVGYIESVSIVIQKYSPYLDLIDYK